MIGTISSISYSYKIFTLLLFLQVLDQSSGFVGVGRKATLTQKVSNPLGVRYQKPNQAIIPVVRPHSTQSITQQTKLHAIQSSARDILPALTKSLLSYGGKVPLSQAFALNVFLFIGLRSKLLKLLTNQGFFHALALGTGLWATLGWRGWTTCVLYLFLGSAVTKVKMQEKEKLGIAEGRGGRRGPENVW